MKRISALVLALSLLLSVSAAAVYSDRSSISPHAAEDVELMYDLDIMRGDGENFRPSSNITREEMFRIVYSLTSKGGRMSDDELGYWTEVMGESSDRVPDAGEIAEWAYPYAGYCYEKGYFVGDRLGRLLPKAEIGAVECATVLLRLLGYTEEDFHAGCTETACYWSDNVTLLSEVLGLFEGVAEDSLSDGITRENVAVMLGNALRSVHATDAAGRTLIDVLFGIESVEDVIKSDILISADGKGSYTGISGNTYDFGEYGEGYSLLRCEVTWVQVEREDGVAYLVPPEVVTDGWTTERMRVSEITSVPKGTAYVYDNGAAEPSYVVDMERMLSLDNNLYDFISVSYKDGVIICDREQVLFRTAENGSVEAVSVNSLTGEVTYLGSSTRMYTDEGFSTAGLDIPFIRFDGAAELQAAIDGLAELTEIDREMTDTDGDGLADRVLTVRNYVEMYRGYAVAAGQEVTDCTPELPFEKGMSAVLWLVEGPTVRKDADGIHADYIGYIGNVLVRVSDIALDDTSDAVGAKGRFVKIVNYGTPTYNPNVYTYERRVLALESQTVLEDYGYVSQYVGIGGYDHKVQLVSFKAPVYSCERIIDTDSEDCSYDDVWMLTELSTRLASDGNTNWKNAYFVYAGDIYFIPVGCLVY